LETCPSP
jgi:hypothetical protein